MKKFLSKVKYPLTAVLLLTLLLFMGCSTETSDDDYYDEEESRDYMTKEEAQSNNGLCILKDDNAYYPAPEGEKPEQVFDTYFNSSYNFLFINANSNIPVLDSSNGDKLILFTSEEINTSEPRTIFPVVQNGYTIPVCYLNFSNESAPSSRRNNSRYNRSHIRQRYEFFTNCLITKCSRKLFILQKSRISCS